MKESFVKPNTTGFADAPAKEADGLEWLRRTAPEGVLRIPRVEAVDEGGLTITAIPIGPWRHSSWRRLGEGLAQMHEVSQPHFGFATDGYIGSNPQVNAVSDDWGQFFIDYRLGFQLGLIRDARLRSHFEGLLYQSAPTLRRFLNKHCFSPSLVHGDLWSGNVLCDRGGEVWLIDPAVYFADREVDIAMTEMFGGFDPLFYQAYGERLPLSANYSVKKEIYNLYHWLNHYNLFGGGYLQSCHRGFEVLTSLSRF